MINDNKNIRRRQLSPNQDGYQNEDKQCQMLSWLSGQSAIRERDVQHGGDGSYSACPLKWSCVPKKVAL